MSFSPNEFPALPVALNGTVIMNVTIAGRDWIEFARLTAKELAWPTAK
jgi:hypothetical protein